MRNPDITLTREEQAFFVLIGFNWKTHDELRCSLEPMTQLALSLFERSAVPKIRIAYFTDPNFNLGGEVGHAKRYSKEMEPLGEEILCHPHFLKHFEYFLCGPNLPTVVIEAFKREALCSGYLTGGRHQ